MEAIDSISVFLYGYDHKYTDIIHFSAPVPMAGVVSLGFSRKRAVASHVDTGQFRFSHY